MMQYRIEVPKTIWWITDVDCSGGTTDTDAYWNNADTIVYRVADETYELDFPPHCSPENVFRCQWVLREKPAPDGEPQTEGFNPMPPRRILRCNRKGIGLRIKRDQ